MTSGAWSNSIPGIGTFFVGIDVAPGRYRCEDGKGGWWVRFTGPGGGEPVGSWPLPAGPTEIEIAPTDFAFETHVGTYWRKIAPPRGEDGQGGAADVRPVADPSLRAELDRIVARQRPLMWLAPLTVLGIGLVGSPILGSLWLLGLAMLAMLVALGSPAFSLDLRRARELARRRDRYLTPEDFDEEGRALLARVQAAVDTVRDSEVNREGLLDALDNAVTLPRQEWEIAQVLARQSRLRGEQREISESAGLPEVEAALRPLREKLEASVAAVTRRVEALERYAERTRAADEALRAHRHLETLAAKAHEYDELLAGTVRDDLAIPAIERLTEHSEALVRTLRSRLAEAAEAGGAAEGELPPSG
ncbi:hypothetical protein Acsp04_14050 [Actinomadura sp. NBRC 104425]|uniref:hypothetical protein n=1 Tax=Actinomadura sp. NBRC 104425 TaxID=3032204 RepID=UPI0024A3558C|nr:hypothetical protein [Actinomadura sp. NBRC 104425]GLZ11170.1 hypothetical protein Acsp04_14050 [Actinomadura sp. NBRC 104425]